MKNMKKKISIAVFASLAAAVCVQAQDPAVYFMEGSTMRSQYNPAFAPLRGYINLPGISGFQVSYNSNISAGDIFFPRNGKLVTMFDSSVSVSEALSGLKKNNLLSNEARVNILGFGAFMKDRKSFWSFDIASRTCAEANLPYSLFEFLKTGQSGSAHDIGVTLDTYLEAGLNCSLPLLDDRLYVGARLKFLAGMGHVRINFDRIDATLSEDRWTIDASGRLDMISAGSAAGMQRVSENPEIGFEDITFSPVRPSGYGFAADLGATYDILPGLQASLAVNDIGFIGWNRESTAAFIAADGMTFEGVEIENGEVIGQPDFDFDIFRFTMAEASAISRALRASVNAGLEYELTDRKVGFGLLYTSRFWNYKALHRLTGAVNLRPARWVTFTGTYSAGSAGGALGAAVSIHPDWINFFVSTDMLAAAHNPQWIPVRQKSLNLTFGLSCPIGRRSSRQEAVAGRNGRR